MYHSTTKQPEIPTRPLAEADYLRTLTPVPTGPILFACWQSLDGGTVCQTLPAVTGALTAVLDGDRFDPARRVPVEPLEDALVRAVPELCHPDGYELTGIGLAAAGGDGDIACSAWIALAEGRARIRQRHSGGAEAEGRIEVGDHVLFCVPEAGLLAVLEQLRAKATGTEPVLPEHTEGGAGSGHEGADETTGEARSDQRARIVCRRAVGELADALASRDEEYLYEDLLWAGVG